MIFLRNCSHTLNIEVQYAALFDSFMYAHNIIITVETGCSALLFVKRMLLVKCLLLCWFDARLLGACD